MRPALHIGLRIGWSRTGRLLACQRLWLAALVTLWIACERKPDIPAPEPTHATATACPARAPAPPLLPGVEPEERTLPYWLSRYSSAELDAPILDVDAIEAHNATVGRRPGRAVFSQRNLVVPADPLSLTGAVKERLRALTPQLASGQLRDEGGATLTADAQAPFTRSWDELTAELHVVLEPTTLRCGPFAGGLYAGVLDRAYDRNACGTVPAQDVIELLSREPGGMWLARSRYSLGFVSPDVKLSPVLSRDHATRFATGPRVQASAPLSLKLPEGAQIALPKHATLPRVGDQQVLLATRSGVATLAKPAEMVPTRRALSRRALLTTAFDLLDAPYGLGGANGGRDCSGLLVDIFASFDLALPRHSGWQAQAGSYSVDVAALSEAEKLRQLELHAGAGVVLLHFPGHIMLYLGKNERGVPMVLHALGDYAEPCASGGETQRLVQRTVVSTLELGRNSSRRAFSERLTKLVVLGKLAGERVAAHAPNAPVIQRNPPAPAPSSPGAPCHDSAQTRLFISPAVPVAGAPLRVIATSSVPTSDAWLGLYDEHGKLLSYDAWSLGGPPYTQVARLTGPVAGRIQAVLGTGDQVLACKRIRVRDAALAMPEAGADAPFWEPRFRWEADTENLFSAFVEQLFTGPADDEQTWTNLHSLLRDEHRNLLHGHLSRDEDAALISEPDCADLPYMLRAYFAWKLRLPYAFRRCSRGRANQAPSCGELQTTLEPRSQPDEVAAFGDFMRRRVRPGVHSATGRTHPDDVATDLYPVALERSALTPGTVFADPYGHVLVVSKWFAQQGNAQDSYGVLIGAEAQPDGTIGRRRFWEGSFLFDPDTRSVGAGFKRFRPLEYERATRSLRALDNAELENSKVFPRFSRAQYEGTRQAFYDRMDELINPKPLDPEGRMRSLVDALDEAARRRVLAIDNGEGYLREHPGHVITMPRGHAIFETTGPWEDFATPSRDMRLLIALDTVMALPERVAKQPERFALKSAQPPEQASIALRQALDRELTARKLQYTRSDGSPHTLTLADVVARAADLELGYNPNDCAEARWGAPEGSAERATCKRFAPAEQRARMLEHRTWFHTRTRPNRGQ